MGFSALQLKNLGRRTAVSRYHLALSDAMTLLITIQRQGEINESHRI